jgi:3-dehydroquinate dehydratase/shikimate dehydrogenase
MAKALLCVTVRGDTTADLRAKRDAVGEADLVELRLDSVRDPNVAAALAGRRTPVIVTCRPPWEGGSFRGSEEERRRILTEALALGAEYVDVEWRARFNDVLARTDGRRIVLSMHDYEGVPSDLRDRLRFMQSTGAEVVKVAVKANRLSDCVPLLDLATPDGHGPALLALALGPHGAPTRILADRFGSKWTYAGSIGELGQLSPEALLQTYRFRSISASTAVYGVVGGGTLGHSVSPAMHNAAFEAAHIDAVYVPFPSVDADDFQTFGRALGIMGASVTIPHKVALFDRVDEVYPVASRIGAINTIRVVDGRWIGGNTDATGFLAPLKDRVALKGLRVSVLGAGGAARAVTVALASAGCSVRLHARNRQQAQEVAIRTPLEIGPWPPEPGSWDLLVNTTPIGMHPHVNETPVPSEQLTGRYVYDLVYNPPATRLVREAAAAGCQALGGLEMLVAQAQEQFQWWTDAKPPKGVMQEAASKRLAEFTRDENYVV